MHSQGTKREQTIRGGSIDREQLEQSADMFEMILQTAPDAVQNYLTLKDIYRQLKRDADFKRIARGLAQVYLSSGQSELAANEYAEILEADPKDEEAITKLREMGHDPSDLSALRAQTELQEIRARCEQKARELAGAEEAFLKASARVRDARRGDDEETRGVLQTIEGKAEEEIQRLNAERERWAKEGRTEIFNQVAESLKKRADRIIQEDEFSDIRKSVKKAEKLLASTDKIFQEEWQRISEERERELGEKVEGVKREGEAKLRCAWQEAVARAEREQATADLALRKLKDELRDLQAELKEKEKLPQKTRRHSIDQPPPPREEAAAPEVVVVAPHGLQTADEPSGESASEPPTTRTARDEVGKALGAILVQHGLVSREHLEEAIAKQHEDHKPIGKLLVESGHATEEDIINALVAQAGVPYLALSNYEISDEVAALIPKELALSRAIMPVDRIANSLLVTMGIPLNKEQKEEVQRHARGMKVRYFISSWSDIRAKHEQHYT